MYDRTPRSNAGARAISSPDSGDTNAFSNAVPMASAKLLIPSRAPLLKSAVARAGATVDRSERSLNDASLACVALAPAASRPDVATNPKAKDTARIRMVVMMAVLSDTSHRSFGPCGRQQPHRRMDCRPGGPWQGPVRTLRQAGRARRRRRLPVRAVRPGPAASSVIDSLKRRPIRSDAVRSNDSNRTTVGAAATGTTAPARPEATPLAKPRPRTGNAGRPGQSCHRSPNNPPLWSLKTPHLDS